MAKLFVVRPNWHRFLVAAVSATIALTASHFASAQSPSAATEIKGAWSGTFFSSHSDMPPFSITVVITPNSNGHLAGDSSLNSECLKGTKLDVAVNGSTVLLAGSDEEGDSLTVHGNLDSSGTLMEATYILNGSATGKCETDNGTGSLAKR